MSKDKFHTKSKQSKFIFWCHTDLPEHYIFIYSTSELGARRRYNTFIWKELRQIIEFQHLIAEKICSIPSNVLKELKIKNNCGVASDDLLNKAGIEWMTKDETVFRCNGKIYRESGLVEKFLKRKKFKYKVLYLFKFKDRPCYKVGISKEIPRRMKEKKGPDNIDLVHFIDTPLSKKLEKNILKQFQKFSLEQEFIGVDEWLEALLLTTFDLYHLEYSKARENHIVSDIYNTLLEHLNQLTQNHKLNASPSNEDINMFNAIRYLIEKGMELRDNEILSNLFKSLTGKRNVNSLSES
jgi:hypothetical protein